MNTNENKPTYLYIKRHSKTGLKYFGMSKMEEDFVVNTYKGSGKIWKQHLKEYGREHVVTDWYCLFENKDDCREFAVFFSDFNQIVSNPAWANKTTEMGSLECSPENRKANSSLRKGNPGPNLKGVTLPYLVASNKRNKPGNTFGKANKGTLTCYDSETQTFNRVSLEEFHKYNKVRYHSLRSTYVRNLQKTNT